MDGQASSEKRQLDAITMVRTLARRETLDASEQLALGLVLGRLVRVEQLMEGADRLLRVVASGVIPADLAGEQGEAAAMVRRIRDAMHDPAYDEALADAMRAQEHQYRVKDTGTP